jgi:iron-sulfur cluster assembly protein
MENLEIAAIKFTQNAIVELKRLMSAPDFDKNQVLRVGVKGGGCSGLSYILTFELPQDKDQFFTIDGIPCMMQPAHGMYLMEMEIDWTTGLDARGFVFTNPNASATCGCGTSFAV